MTQQPQTPQKINGKEIDEKIVTAWIKESGVKNYPRFNHIVKRIVKSVERNPHVTRQAVFQEFLKQI